MAVDGVSSKPFSRLNSREQGKIQAFFDLFFISFLHHSQHPYGYVEVMESLPIDQQKKQGFRPCISGKRFFLSGTARSWTRDVSRDPEVGLSHFVAAHRL